VDPADLRHPLASKPVAATKVARRAQAEPEAAERLKREVGEQVRPEVARQVGARCAGLRAEFRAASAGPPPGRLGLNATPVGLAELVGREVRTGLGQSEGAPHGRQGLLRGAPASVCCASPRRRDWDQFP
jgi:hypothetical protein